MINDKFKEFTWNIDSGNSVLGKLPYWKREWHIYIMSKTRSFQFLAAALVCAWKWGDSFPVNCENVTQVSSHKELACQTMMTWCWINTGYAWEKRRKNPTHSLQYEKRNLLTSDLRRRMDVIQKAFAFFYKTARCFQGCVPQGHTPPSMWENMTISVTSSVSNTSLHWPHRWEAQYILDYKTIRTHHS